MEENSNKTLAYNAIVLYTKLVINTICSLFTTRFALQALGVVDYGLYSVLGGIIAFIAIINTIMISSSHRFIAVAIGKNDDDEANQQFNACLAIHLVIALVTLVVAIPIGDWYINHYINYEGDIQNALMVFHISVIAAIISFIGVPYNALLTAKEKFIVFCIPDILSHIMRLAVSLLLVYWFSHKLLIYTIAQAFFTIYPIIVYVLYCTKNYSHITKFRIIKDKSLYKGILGFSGWVGYGAVAYVGKAQGASLLVNAFFNTIMNTALGIANSVSSLIGLFANNVAQPMAPQITKCYAAGNFKRCETLMIMSTKFTYLVMLLVAAPFLIDTEWLLSIWLKDVPPFAVEFTILVIIDHLIDSLNSGIKNVIFADGNIKLFQIIPSTLKLMAIAVAFVVLKMGAPAQSLLYAYIIFSVIVFISNQWILARTVKINSKILIKKSYLPSFVVTLLFLPLVFLHIPCHPILKIAISEIYLFFIVFIIALDKQERQYIIGFVKNKFKKIK